MKVSSCKNIVIRKMVLASATPVPLLKKERETTGYAVRVKPKNIEKMDITETTHRDTKTYYNQPSMSITCWYWLIFINWFRLEVRISDITPNTSRSIWTHYETH